jgi:hypothetical protein
VRFGMTRYHRGRVSTPGSRGGREPGDKPSGLAPNLCRVSVIPNLQGPRS